MMNSSASFIVTFLKFFPGFKLPALGFIIFPLILFLDSSGILNDFGIDNLSSDLLISFLIIWIICIISILYYLISYIFNFAIKLWKFPRKYWKNREYEKTVVARLNNLSSEAENIVIDAVKRNDRSFKAPYDYPYAEELIENELVERDWFFGAKVYYAGKLEKYTFKNFVFKAMKRKYH